MYSSDDGACAFNFTLDITRHVPTHVALSYMQVTHIISTPLPQFKIKTTMAPLNVVIIMCDY